MMSAMRTWAARLGWLGLCGLGLLALAGGCSADGGGVAKGSASAGGASSAGSAGVAGGSSVLAGGAGGVGGSGGGTGGGLPLGDSLTDGCIAYALAACGRMEECEGRGAGRCLGATFACPDLVSSPGATRTAAGLKACAIEYASFSCAELLSGARPACVTPGMRLPGEPCLYPSQCSTLSCKPAGDACGVCTRIVGEGEDCSAADVDCAFHLNCEFGTCVNLRPSGGGGAGGGPALPGGAGEPCQNGCIADHHCDPADTDLCVPYPGQGMSCQVERTCGFGSYCELAGLVCKVRPGQGAACGVDGFTGQAAYCSEGLVCKRTSKSEGSCEPPPAIGQPCFNDPETNSPALYSCGIGKRCDASVSPALCVGPLPPGGDCTSAGLCELGLHCQCDDPAGNDPASCLKRSCVSLRYGQQPCGEPGTACHPGFSCTGGLCVPRDSRGLFEAACPP